MRWSFSEVPWHPVMQTRYTITPSLYSVLSASGARRITLSSIHDYIYKKAVLPQGNRAMPQVFFSVEVRQQHSLQV